MNYYERTVALALAVIAILLGLHFLPPLQIRGKALRPVNLLSDIVSADSTREDWETALLTHDSATVDSVAPVDSIKKKKLPEELEDDVKGIADYSANDAMQRFYKRLTQGGTVRIAYFGDSFVEGDILTAPLRELLQHRFGGAGVGFVDMSTGLEGFRQSVRHTNGGFSIHSVTDKSFDPSLEGINQRYFLPKSGPSFVSLSTPKGAKHAKQSTIYFVTTDSMTLIAKVNGEEADTFSFSGSTALQHATVYGDLGKVEWLVVRNSVSGTMCFYGATLDDANGVVLDNFSVRGSSGASLARLPMERMHEWGRVRSYDLIILHFGLNVANEQSARQRYSGYCRKMDSVIEHLRQCFPEAAILVVSCSDRDSRHPDGHIGTMPGLRTLVSAQHQIARDNGCAFWNLYQAMGGEGSMRSMSQTTPPEANKDYTHLTHQGGRKLARIFYDALMNGGGLSQ